MIKIKVSPKKLKDILKQKKCNTPFGKYIANTLGHHDHPLAKIPDVEFGSKLLFTHIEFINDSDTNKPDT